MSELQVVPGGGADMTFAMVVKQAQSLHVNCLADRRGDHLPDLDALMAGELPLPVMDDEMSEGEAEDPDPGREIVEIAPAAGAVAEMCPPVPDRIQPDDQPRVITVIALTTDAGSDEAAARRMIQNIFLKNAKVWVVEQHCLQHQYNLIVLNSLKRANTFMDKKCEVRYLPLLTKLMHIWRARAVTIYKTWCRMFTASDAECASRVPPKCIQGRWGFVSKCESFILGCHLGQLAAVFQLIFEEDASKKDKKAKKEKDPMEVRAESTTAYMEQLSRWSKDVCEGILKTSLFFG
eukprot:6881571-Pyramimonas_sp.AAC.1